MITVTITGETGADVRRMLLDLTGAVNADLVRASALVTASSEATAAPDAPDAPDTPVDVKPMPARSAPEVQRAPDPQEAAAAAGVEPAKRTRGRPRKAAVSAPDDSAPVDPFGDSVPEPEPEPGPEGVQEWVQDRITDARRLAFDWMTANPGRQREATAAFRAACTSVTGNAAFDSARTAEQADGLVDAVERAIDELDASGTPEVEL